MRYSWGQLRHRSKCLDQIQILQVLKKHFREHSLPTRGRRKRRLTPCIFTDYWDCGKFVLYDNYDLLKHEYSQTTILLQRRSVWECTAQWIHNRHTAPRWSCSHLVIFGGVRICPHTAFFLTFLQNNYSVEWWKHWKGPTPYLCRYLTVADPPRNGPYI